MTARRPVAAALLSLPAVLAAGFLVATTLGAMGCVQAKPPTDTGDVASLPSGPNSATPSPAASPGNGSAQSLAYAPDLQPVFASDCLSCHTDRRPLGNYSMSSYQAVMRAVRPGDASSLLVRDTQPSGSMYRYFSGNRSSKAAMVYDWVVRNSAAERRQ